MLSFTHNCTTFTWLPVPRESDEEKIDYPDDPGGEL